MRIHIRSTIEAQADALKGIQGSKASCRRSSYGLCPLALARPRSRSLPRSSCTTSTWRLRRRCRYSWRWRRSARCAPRQPRRPRPDQPAPPRPRVDMDRAQSVRDLRIRVHLATLAAALQRLLPGGRAVPVPRLDAASGRRRESAGPAFFADGADDCHCAARRHRQHRAVAVPRNVRPAVDGLLQQGGPRGTSSFSALSRSPPSASARCAWKHRPKRSSPSPIERASA